MVATWCWIASGRAGPRPCRQLLTEGDRSLELLHDCFADDEEFVERFRREACSTAGLQHRHIVSVYDHGEWNGTHYIVMEYVPGRSLKAIIREQAPLAPARAVDLAVQLLRTAGFVHSHGIVHRDLRPDNAILDDDGCLKLTDFGIARSGDRTSRRQARLWPVTDAQVEEVIPQLGVVEHSLDGRVGWRSWRSLWR